MSVYATLAEWRAMRAPDTAKAYWIRELVKAWRFLGVTDE